MFVVGALGMLTGACADQHLAAVQGDVASDEVKSASVNGASVNDASGKGEKVIMQRVIVNLTPSDLPVPDQASTLAAKYPQAKLVRVFAGFRQAVLELPSADIKRLEQEPEVEQLALDRTNLPSQ